MVTASIIIPVSAAHNQNGILSACLKSLGSQTYPKEGLEIVVVGDGCKVAIENTPQNINTKIYNFAHRAGLGAVRNKGIEISQGEYIVFIDADCEAQKGWSANLLKGIEEGNAVACGGRILDSKGICQNKKWVYAQGNCLPFTSLGNAVFRKAVLREIGFFDERFSRYMEDIDLCWRICLKGHQIKYVPEATVIHNSKDTARKSFSKGLGARLIENKYRRLLHFSPCQELKKVLQIKNDFSPTGIKKYFFFSCGYLCALLKEWLWFFPKQKEVEIEEQSLQSKYLLEPLNVELNGKKLTKPNHVVWWESEGGIRILDVKGNREFVLHDMSGKMWEYMMEGGTEGFVLSKISEEYEVPEQELEEDFKDFKEHLFKEKILIPFEELNYLPAKIQSFIYNGKSMSPFLSSGDIILTEKAKHKKLRLGEVIVYQGPERLIIHRFLYYKREKNTLRIVAKGDNSLQTDNPFDPLYLVGKALVINKRRGQVRLESFLWRIFSVLLGLVSLSEAVIYENALHIKQIFFKRTKTIMFIKRFVSRIIKFPIFLLSKALAFSYR